MTFRIELSDTARKNLKELDAKIRRRIIDKLENLSEQPFVYAKRLRGMPLWSLRVGDHRVIMEINLERNTILVMRAGHRGKVYDKL